MLVRALRPCRVVASCARVAVRPTPAAMAAATARASRRRAMATSAATCSPPASFSAPSRPRDTPSSHPSEASVAVAAARNAAANFPDLIMEDTSLPSARVLGESNIADGGPRVVAIEDREGEASHGTYAPLIDRGCSVLLLPHQAVMQATSFLRSDMYDGLFVTNGVAASKTGSSAVSSARFAGKPVFQESSIAHEEQVDEFVSEMETTAQLRHMMGGDKRPVPPSIPVAALEDKAQRDNAAAVFAPKAEM